MSHPLYVLLPMPGVTVPHARDDPVHLVEDEAEHVPPVGVVEAPHYGYNVVKAGHPVAQGKGGPGEAVGPVCGQALT